MMITDLPLELCCLIMLKLPVKSLLRLRCVCKLFRSMIDDPHFTKLHHSRSLACPESSTRILVYNINDDDNVDFFSVEIGGDQQAVRCATFPMHCLVSFFYRKSDNVRSDVHYDHYGELNLRFCPGYVITWIINSPQVVKGLILLKDQIWNPLTGHLITLPHAEEDLPKWKPPTNHFLGFDPHTNQYKVLYIRHYYYQEKESYSTVCKILTIGIDGIIGSWRFIKTYPKEMPTLQSPVLRGCGNDMLYLSNPDYYPGGVLALDLHTEVFHTPSFPVDNISQGWSIYNAFPGRSVFNHNTNFWLSNGKGGWDQRLLDIPRPHTVYDTLGKGEILLCYDNDTMLAGFNLETGFLREIHTPNLQDYLSDCYVFRTHVECLIRF
ncbi:putative F-box protein At1g50870 [Impatiens glandulifera]|uniref:putative F-box protein At1g50870 n=1 Tax=Impatiens glandulifera TaxID=253017 RepID=UPI001FB0A7B8|nr:putative F-box protein At1g50870 [Impatiens glandulifera]